MKTQIAVSILIFSVACGTKVTPPPLAPPIPGPKGDVGETGASGSNGQGCVVVPQVGGALVTCGASSVFVANGVDGSAGPQGPAGNDGTGIVGPQGLPGQDGVDITPITVVTLCPGVSSYPGVFVEVGLCLGGNLYGVYSANGGFLTYLPPGNYTSAGIGSSCNLTIAPNCQVTH